MAGLGIVAQQDQRHAGHEADIFQPATFVRGYAHFSPLRPRHAVILPDGVRELALKQA
jgi:Ser/Thr protein kinase RdoA (MazF antagonist)